MCQAMSALITAKQKGDPAGWRAFQERAHALKNQRTRARREAEDLGASLFAAQTALRLQSEGALGTTPPQKVQLYRCSDVTVPSTRLLLLNVVPIVHACAVSLPPSMSPSLAFCGTSGQSVG